jgi:hypothetical protein
MSILRPTRLAGLVAALCLASGVTAAPSSASMIVDRSTHGAKLEVDRTGKTALVSYRSSDGLQHHVLYWGAVDWDARFQRDYSGGWGSHHADWHTFKNACRPYTGPELDLLVAACDAPDGSHWALQAWPRLWKNYGGRSAREELHVSHWTGDLGVLDIRTDWGYHGRFEHLYGTFTYHDVPVFGLKHTRTGVPLDSFGRNIYLDYHAGGAWQRENSFLTHPRTGGFCYLFGHHAGRIGTGDTYRATVIGPGVSPLVRAQFAPPGQYSEAADAERNADQQQLLSAGGKGDSRCVVN